MSSFPWREVLDKTCSLCWSLFNRLLSCSSLLFVHPFHSFFLWEWPEGRSLTEFLSPSSLSVSTMKDISSHGITQRRRQTRRTEHLNDDDKKMDIPEATSLVLESHLVFWGKTALKIQIFLQKIEMTLDNGYEISSFQVCNLSISFLSTCVTFQLKTDEEDNIIVALTVKGRERLLGIPGINV